MVGERGEKVLLKKVNELIRALVNGFDISIADPDYD